MKVGVHNLFELLTLAYIPTGSLSTTPSTHLEFHYHQWLGHELVVQFYFSLLPLVKVCTCLLFLSFSCTHGPLCIFSDSSCYSSHHTFTVYSLISHIFVP